VASELEVFRTNVGRIDFCGRDQVLIRRPPRVRGVPAFVPAPDVPTAAAHVDDGAATATLRADVRIPQVWGSGHQSTKFNLVVTLAADLSVSSSPARFLAASLNSAAVRGLSHQEPADVACSRCFRSSTCRRAGS